MTIGPNQLYTEELLPAYFLGPDALPYFDTSGTMKDAVNSSAIDAVEAAFVQTAPNDALDNLGNNFFIDRPPLFTDDQWRTKLSKVWDFWRTSGTAARLISEIKDLGYPNVSITPQWVEFPSGVFTKTFPDIIDINPYMNVTPDPSGQGWWSNFYLIIDLPYPFTLRKWGTPEAGIWGVGDINTGPYKWGSVYGAPGSLSSIIATIRKLKPAWTSCRGIVFIKSTGTLWGGFNYNDGTLWGLSPSDYFVQSIIEDWEEN